MADLTHIDSEGRARMVHVGEKAVLKRKAKARGTIRLAADTLSLIRQNLLKKGDVLTVSEIAGVQAAKQTATLIPLCHNIVLEKVSVILTMTEGGIQAESEVHCTGKTGVEMEALTAVSVALLTVYDMCKAVDKSMEITAITLIEKTKSDPDE